MAKHLRITVEGKVYDVVVEDLTEDTGSTFYQMPSVATAAPRPVAAAPAPAAAPAAARPAAAGGKTKTSPMGGVIVDVKVKAGDAVKTGQELVILEAMKMKQAIVAEFDGTVADVPVKVGDTVDTGQVLVSFA